MAAVTSDVRYNQKSPHDLSHAAPSRDRISVEAQALMDAAARRVVVAYGGSVAGRILAMLGLDKATS